ncbi:MULTISPECIES: hypothetical protein [unclassified Sphingomonas]|uniref:hypothetical protein n=1 Tax=unclassified Sphingomonas TaxID=196159 RepID=UPI0012E3F137|nr:MULTISPECIES: hypothetical protein [unclassified Sphingomonas]
MHGLKLGSRGWDDYPGHPRKWANGVTFPGRNAGQVAAWRCSPLTPLATATRFRHCPDILYIILSCRAYGGWIMNGTIRSFRLAPRRHGVDLQRFERNAVQKFVLRAATSFSALIVTCALGPVTFAQTPAPVNVTLSQSQPGPFTDAVRPNVSINSYWLNDQNAAIFFNSTTVAQLFNTLGGSDAVRRLRIGGSGGDTTFWTSTNEPTPAWATYVPGSTTQDGRGRITPASLTALRNFVNRTGWGIVLTVNLRQRVASPASDAARAANFVAAARAQLGSGLAAVQVGNEPDLYGVYGGGSGPGTYFSHWRQYRTAIEQAAPNTRYYMAATASIGGFLDAFVQNELALPSPDINALTAHHYNGCATNFGSISNLTSRGVYDGQINAAQFIVSRAANPDLNVPAVLDERNSYSCAGRPAVSNSFAAALWTLDSSLLFAREGIQRHYLHSMFGRCGDIAPEYGWYSLFCSPDDAARNAGAVQAAVPFYGALAARLVGSGHFLPVTFANSDDLNQTRVYALRAASGNGLTVVVVNYSDPDSSSSRVVNVDLGRLYASASSIVLQTSSASDLSATTTAGITLGGGSVSTTGVFSGATWTNVPVTPVGGSNSSIAITSQPATATIIRLN